MRRLFWIGIGAAAGASGTVWTQRRVKAQLDELGPEHMVAVAGRGAAVAGRGAKAVGRTVATALSEAVGEGRTAMADREVELKRKLLGHDALLDLRPDPPPRAIGTGGRGFPTSAERRGGK